MPQVFAPKEELYTTLLRERSNANARARESLKPEQLSQLRMDFVRSTHKDVSEFQDPMDYPADPYNSMDNRILVEKDPQRRPVTEKIVNEKAPELPVRERETFAEYARRKKLNQDDLIIPAKGPKAEEGFFEALARRGSRPSLADQMPLYSSFSGDFVFREPVLPEVGVVKRKRPVNLYAKSLTMKPKQPPPRFPKGP